MLVTAALALWNLVLGATLGAVPAQVPSQPPQTTIRTEVALVNVLFSAVDSKNRPVANLTAEDFAVYEDRKLQQIMYFSEMSEASELPLTIALLIDTSGSVRSKLDYEKETAAEFFRSILRPEKDLALIIQFDSEVNLVQDFTADPDRLVAALDTLRAGNSTSLYDAIYLAVEEKLKYEVGRKVIVVITDGSDTSSKLSKEEAIETAQRGDVLIYGIGVQSEYGTSFRELKKFAEETGGSFFSPKAKRQEIQTAFKAIGEELKNQYSLAYTSTNKSKDGKFRSITLRCQRKGVRIRARRGYYAPKAGQGSRP